jgi:PhoH-like ATPase
VKRVVLDTNVILDNPQVVLRNDVQIVLPYVVLAELDKLKRDQDLRFSAQMAIKNIKQGFLDKRIEILNIPDTETTNDEKIVATAKDSDCELWTGDVGASVIALTKNVPLFDESYIDSDYDADYCGYSEWGIESEIYYNFINKTNIFQVPEIEELTPIKAVINEYVRVFPLDGSANYKILRKRVNDYIHVSESKKLFSKLSALGDPTAKHALDFDFLDPEQAMAFDAVFNSDTPLAVICGKIGSGKTLLSTIAALARVEGSNTNRLYSKILVTRPNRPISKAYEIGFLPGDENAKLKSWLSGFTSNLEFLFEKNLKDVEEKKAELIFQKYFKPIAIESAQGASWHDCIFLIDEGQLLEEVALKQLMSRLSTGSKCVIIMDPDQTYGANRGHEGFKKLLPKCKGNELISFVKLKNIQRSPLTKLVDSIF